MTKTTMAWRALKSSLLFCAVAWLALASLAMAAEYRGVVAFGGVPVPGATVTAIQGGKKLIAITGQDGSYVLPDLPDGAWTIEVQMTGFATIKQEVTIASGMPAAQWNLTLLPLDQIKAAPAPAPGENTPARTSVAAQTKPQANTPEATAPAPAPDQDLSQRANNGLLINGSVNNGADSPFAQSAAFGNNRSKRGLYNFNIGAILDNSALDARQYSLTGLNLPKPGYNQVTGVAAVGGPLMIPRLLPNGPTFFVAYQWTRNREVTTEPATVPTPAERGGDFSQAVDSSGNPIQIFNPATGLPFPGNLLPAINPQAQALLSFYPLPNSNGGTQYNYEIPIVAPTHQDALQSRLSKGLNPTNQVYGALYFQSTRSSSPNLFNFVDTTDVLGVNASVHWQHRFAPRLFMTPGYQFSRLRTRVTPFFANRQNVSGQAGIAGNLQDPTDWGPPGLNFSSGILGLSDGLSAFNRNETNAASISMYWNRERHNFTFGGDFRREEFNVLSQANPRGGFTFTGAATQGTVNGAPVGGSDFADFLLGIPDTSAIAFGNADKYFRESVYDAFFVDDWRMSPGFTANIGVRWEYSAPMTELKGRLVNLDIAPGFTAVAPVVASNPVGPLTGRRYPSSLLNPDRNGIEPRIGISWRPLPASSLVVRAGYGIYQDTSVYQTIASQMAQQAPLSKSLSVQNSAACPLTLANGFNPCSSTTENTFAVDPNFRVGYAQTWDLIVQRDLPGSLQLLATYSGVKGTRGTQEFLPNTYPIGAVNPCPSCPVGFAYLTSGGNSTRQAGTLQLRRRLHSGFTATVQYTFSKSIDDDAALGGQGPTTAGQGTSSASGGPSSQGESSSGSAAPNLAIAQNWLDLRAERGLSTFDQRHLLDVQAQYTTGMGLKGGTLLSGWKGALYKEWTFLTKITVGSGLPQTPVYAAAVPATGVTNTIRPDVTGAPLYKAPPGYFLNVAAFTAPAPGQWGDAGRDSIIGPLQFSLDASMARAFRLKGRYNLNLRFDSANLLNHVTYTAWNATTNSPQFGLPAAANGMRTIETTLMLKF